MEEHLWFYAKLKGMSIDAMKLESTSSDGIGDLVQCSVESSVGSMLVPSDVQDHP